METAKMYISNEPQNGHTTTKFASTNSIPAAIMEQESSLARILGAVGKQRENAAILRDSKSRRHSVLEDLKARRDSLFQRARRASVFDDKDNNTKDNLKNNTKDNNVKENNVKDNNAKDKPKDKRRSSDSGRRSSVFYVSEDLLEENQEAPENEDCDLAIQEAKKGRRKSWHPLVKPPKLDRKRRKGVSGIPSQTGSTEGLYSQNYVRQKRPSWWNIFVPDSVVRSKSRSVDHGFTAPFDLDSLRNKVEGRFESVDKLAKDSDNESKDGSTSQEKKHGRVSQPINTIAYTVGDRDTLTSVAARFDTTPSELSKLNRLGSTFIYSGQQLWVPTKGEGRPGGESTTNVPSPDPCHDHESQDDLPPEEKELLDNLRPVSPKPGHMERVKTPLGTSSGITEEDEQPFRERFLKINVRHITDGQGVVGGVLLVTPNAVMFDPNVSDPLVIEHGAESYGVIAPMEFVVNAAIYYDIAHMRVSHTESGHLDKKPEIYYMKKPQIDNRKCQSPGKDENFPELAGDDSESVCSCAERDGDAFPKAFERELVTPTNLQSEENSNSTKEKEKDNSDKEFCSGGQASRTLEERRRSMLDHHWAVPSKDRTFSVDDEQQDSLNSDKMEPAKSNAIPEDEEGSLVKLSCHDSGIDIRDPNPPIPVVQPIPSKKVYSDADIVLSSDWVPPITIAPTNVTSSLDAGPTPINGRKKASSVSFSLESNAEEPEKDEEHKEDDKQETRRNKMLKRLSYPLSWMEGLTGEKEDESSKSISDKVSSLPNSADSHHSSVFSKVFSRRSSVGTFIRQQPLTSSGSSSVDSSRGSKTSTMAPRLDYRSMVSVEDMPELFVSFDKLIPRPARSCEDPPLYLRLRTGRPKDKKIPRSTPIMSYGKKKLRPEYWFSVPRNRVDDLYRFIHAWVPNLYGELDENYWRERGYILSDTDTDLSPELSPHESGEGADSTEESKTRDGQGDDITELTRESWEVFGALTSCALHVSDHFYGTGESLLFRFTPKFQCFNWSGDNLYFIKGNNESLAIGAGDGKFGLWLDGDLYQGRTQSCSTYANDPLAPREDFVVKTLECWAFI
ncbi:hypothetical protein ACFW04_000528 [Cataglyphis niger]